MKKTVLFICVHNSARSQLAEGLVNALYADRFEAVSGGTTATRVHPAAIKAMAEIGIDISGHYSKSIDVFEGRRFDYVVMVCDDKQADCPFFPGRQELHPPCVRRPGGLHGNGRGGPGLFPKDPGRDPRLDRKNARQGNRMSDPIMELSVDKFPIPLSIRPLLQRGRGLGRFRGTSCPHRPLRLHSATERGRRLRRAEGGRDSGPDGG